MAAHVMSDHNLILWEAAHQQPVAVRMAIAGDFLPAGKLAFPADCNWGSMARGLAGHFEDVAVSFVNLESALNVAGLAPRMLSGIGQIVSAPDTALEYLRAIRSRAVGIANNHSFDFGGAGVQRTRLAISHHGLVPIGAGRTLSEQPEVLVWQGPGDIRVGFWAAAKATLDPATESFAGVEPATHARARQAIESMKSQGAQACIALLHAGCLRTNRPDPEDLRLLDSLARYGFDVVAASHSHRISGFRQLGNLYGRPSFCFYGLGSLVSGYAIGPLEREGLIVVAGLSERGELTRLELRPVLLDETGFGNLPSPEMSRSTLTRFGQLSSEIADGSFERLFYRDVSQGLLRLYVRDLKTACRQAGIRGLARKVRRVRVRHIRRLVHLVVG
jgi:hypothetical protein